MDSEEDEEFFESGSDSDMDGVCPRFSLRRWPFGH